MVKKALLVGINYIGSDSQLSGCINDTTTIGAILTGKFKFNTVKTLTDNTIVKPTKINIEASLRELVAGSKAGDILVFHYSGHGSNVADRSGDESDKRDEVIVPLDYKTSGVGVISDDWIYQNICVNVPAGVVLWCFTDCCHSGTILDLAFNVRSNCAPISAGEKIYSASKWSNNFSFSVEKVPRDLVGTVLNLSGCQDPETSADAFIAGKGQGAFTACFSEILKRDDVTNMTVRDILKEVNARLDLQNFKQNSQLSLSNMNNLNSKFAL